jgi:hypothetical protein
MQIYFFIFLKLLFQKKIGGEIVNKMATINHTINIGIREFGCYLTSKIINELLCSELVSLSK